MEFEKHLFISYAHLDNRPMSPEQDGWISRFHVALDALLSMRIGKEAVIWRDFKLGGTDDFVAEIISQFPKTAVLLSVLSPRYLKSPSCTQELEEFCKAAEKSLGLRVGNRYRIVKIVKSPIDEDHRLPDVMKAMLGYQFYDLDKNNFPLELDPAFGPEMAQKYNVKVAKLAWEIALVLKSLTEAGPLQQPAAAEQVKPAVYLAECSFDQRDAREALDAELKCHGYRVLPQHQLPRDEAAYAAEVSELLKQCQLSIHLVGSNYGVVPDGPTDKSIVVIQNELATQCSRERGLRRIVWLPEGTTPKQQEQKAFVLQLQTDPEAQFGADLITSNERETIKSAIHAALAKLQATAATQLPGARPREKMVYLICDKRDRAQTIQARRFLRSRGIEVAIPLFEGDAATVRQANEELLLQSGAVMVFYGEGGEAWKRSVDSEIRKVRGSAAAQFPVYTYLTGPETDAKRELIELEEPQLLNCLQGFSEGAVMPFTQEFERYHQ